VTPEAFLQLSNLLPEPTLLLLGDGTIVAANRATEDRLGLGPKVALGQQLAQIVSDAPETVAHYLRACCRSRTLVLGSVTLKVPGGKVACRAEGAVLRPTAEGTDALILMRLLPKHSAVGQFVALNQRIAELGREIHRRKEAEAVIRRQEARLRVTLDSIGDAVIVTDAEGRVTSLNPVARTLTGWSNDEASGRPLTEVFPIFHEVSRQPIENPVAKVIETGTVVGLGNHTILVSKEGSERPIDDSAAPIKDEQGAIVGVVLVFRDVTEKREAETQLLRSERSSRYLAEASSLLATVIDYESTLRQIAHLAVPFLADCCAVDMVEPDGSLRRVAVAHADPQQDVHALLDVPLLVRGKSIGVISFFAADSGRSYTALDRRLAEDLAGRAAVAIDNARLYQELRDADRKKDAFLATLAHELRNPHFLASGSGKIRSPSSAMTCLRSLP
jgi:PAS domain S-box-containing protein